MASKKFHKNLIMFHNPDSIEAERFRMLRSNLLFSGSGNPPRSILVTSAVPGEGKSFVASNLAISLAQCVDVHVLLVDCDIRKPDIHTRFGFEDGPGLSEYHLEDLPLAEMLLKPGIGNLTILPGGRPPLNPSELLSSVRMSALLDEVKNRYDDRHIIIDSPPPIYTSEAKALSGQVDGIILVVKFRSTPKELVEETVDIIGKEKIIGVIMNRANTKIAGNDYKSGYYYGKKRRKYYSR
ncbi:MAG: CpsD/CapB family tyrosine-protein kinase [Desulfobacterales bacterium]|nr:CpsD/CapB family tyrosine-protein kinase [Desulfobacterales bacterium]